jgi:hypothetical protein
MKYMILIHHNPKAQAVWETMSYDERVAGLREYESLRVDLAAAGELIASEALADPQDGRRLPATVEGAISTDGPFAEAKEHLAGFFLIECEDMAHAVERAARIPESAYGFVQVRPVRDLSEFLK